MHPGSDLQFTIYYIYDLSQLKYKYPLSENSNNN